MRETVYVSLPEAHMVIMIKDVQHPQPIERCGDISNIFFISLNVDTHFIYYIMFNSLY